MRALDGIRARFLGLGLNAKLLGAFLLVLLPVLVLLLMGIDERRRSREESVADGLLLTAQAVAIQVGGSFDAAINLGWAVANDPLVQTMDPRILDPHLMALVARTPDYWTLAVFDAAGVNRGWGNLSEPAEPRLNISNDAHFRRVMATNLPTISNVQQLDRPPTLGFVAATPIRDADGRAVGVVTIVTRTDQLATQYAATQRQAGQAIFAVDPSGHLAFYSLIPDLTLENSDAFAAFPPVRRALAGIANVDTDFVSPYFGDRRLGAFAPTPRYQWAVGVTTSREIALAPVQQTLRDQLIGFAYIVLLSAILATVLSRLLAAPIRRLDEAATALGHGDRTRRVPGGPNDEIGHLGRSFNEMADRLEARQLEVARLSAEAERRANKLAAIIASVPSAIYVVDTRGRLVDTNPAGLSYLGLSSVREVTGSLGDIRESMQMRHPDGRPMTDDEMPIVRALRGETIVNVEALIRDPAGEDRVMNVSGAPVRDESGNILLGVVIARDVTEQRRSEEERSRLLERERALFAITRALLRETELGRVVETAVARGAAALRADVSILWLAIPERRELQLLAHRGLSAETAERLSRLPYDSSLPSARAADSGEVQIVADLRADAMPFTRELAQREDVTTLLSVPLLRRGRVVGVITHLYRRPREIAESDVEFATTLGQLFAVAIENARLFDQVREALRLREEFMATAAHELKTPVTIITGYSEILLRLHQTPTLTQRGLEAIDRQAKRIARLVEDLLAVVRIRPGIAALRRETFDLATLVRTRIGDRAADPSHPIRLEQDGGLIVTADGELIAEVVDQILDNAARYSPNGGPIEVKTRRSSDGTEAVIAVRDFGYPIPPERRPHVFEPFYEPVPSGETGYLGLVSIGLYLSREIVDAHGGRIWLDVLPDGSKVFSFSLPLTGG